MRLKTNITNSIVTIKREGRKKMRIKSWNLLTFF
jgi:hypothetical protein